MTAGHPSPPPPPRHQGLPAWLTATVVVTLLGLLAYSVIVLGPEGLPLSVMLGGLLAGYGGINQFIKRNDG